jgi:hypothetical protein
MRAGVYLQCSVGILSGSYDEILCGLGAVLRPIEVNPDTCSL